MRDGMFKDTLTHYVTSSYSTYSSCIKVTKPSTLNSMLNFLISGERGAGEKSFHKTLLIYLNTSLSQVSILSFFSSVFFVPMRPEDNNTLDLNNFPDDPSRDLFPFFEEGSSSSSSSGGFREKQGKDGKEYECRFCSLKFFKSQALGGHMNRHRQERETESLNKARELVLRNDNFPPHQGPPPFSYHQGDVHIGDLITSFKPLMYPPRQFSISTSSSALLYPPPPQPSLVQPYLYPPPPSPFPHHHTNDYYLGNNNDTRHQALTNSVCGGRAPSDSSYTFIGAPVANGSRAAPPLPRPLPPHHGL